MDSGALKFGILRLVIRANRSRFCMLLFSHDMSSSGSSLSVRLHRFLSLVQSPSQSPSHFFRRFTAMTLLPFFEQNKSNHLTPFSTMGNVSTSTTCFTNNLVVVALINSG
uniref:ORF41 n=1 Tax=Malaco herpesvirus 4 TaxID=3031800 RepID=A0AA48P7N8_9VIRU|nr:TPA_asm: ORF41 [Malaco herpesvirus 4]